MKFLKKSSIKITLFCAFGILSACAHIGGDASKQQLANSPTAGVAKNGTAAPSLSSALAWRPLLVAASPAAESQVIKPVATIGTTPAVTALATASLPAILQVNTVMTIPKAQSTQPVVLAASSAPPAVAPVALQGAQLKLDRSLDSLKYAVYFEYASANLNPTGKAALEYLQADAKAAEAIEVIGRADPSGNASKNEKLAIARADSVRKELLKYGVQPKTVKVKSFVALAHADGRSAYKQNLPSDLSAASRRADVDMLVKPNVVSKLTVHSNFVAVPS
jgi:outer membrane protein OmpA-like peptidoglycan-associated protein